MLSSGARQRRENKAYPPGLDRNNSKFAQRTTAFMRKQSFFVSMCWSVSKSVDAIQALSRFEDFYPPSNTILFHKVVDAYDLPPD